RRQGRGARARGARGADGALSGRRETMSAIFGPELGEELTDLEVELGRIRDLGTGVATTLRNAFRGLMLEGRSLRGLLADIGRAFADIALKAALKPLETLTGGLVESLFARLNPALGGVTAFAKGGVISAPSYFPMAGQWGLAGEAGREAILPLQRDSSGRLGVAAQGEAARPITVNITASDARSFMAAEAEVSAMLLRA